MTLPIERTRALLQTEAFLLRLCSPEKTPDVPQSFRDEARGLLRHFPNQYDLSVVVERWQADSSWHGLIPCPFGDPKSLSAGWVSAHCETE